MDPNTLPSSLPAWHKLNEHRDGLESLALSQLFATDSERADKFSVQVGDMFVDYSKHLITPETLKLLLELAEDCRLQHHIDAMFSGEQINTTEGRAAGHFALRDTGEDPLMIQGEDVRPKVNDVLGRMRLLASTVRDGNYMGFSGRPIKNIINIGIGGSDLGPAMATLALEHYTHQDLKVRFVSNVDPADFVSNIRGLDPAETLFIVASKTFTTLETMANAETARRWIVEGMGNEEAVKAHFIALSTNLEATTVFGVPQEHVFEFWDWVGGRYSLTSAIGLPVMIAIGPEAFDQLRAGFHIMDRHFQGAPLEKNTPVLLALIGIWYRNFLGGTSSAIIPYSHALRRFPAYCQQLIMESNGKDVTRGGQPVTYNTSAVIWGEPGTNAQHSFFQLIHQGTDIIPCDLIGVKHSSVGYEDMHKKLLANMIAQGEALAFGRPRDESHGATAAHQTFGGNRPTTTILLDSLTPGTLGQLIALYEHITFVQGAIWNINSFDQYGVQLGKHLTGQILDDLQSNNPSGHDSSTQQLIHRSFHE